MQKPRVHHWLSNFLFGNRHSKPVEQCLCQKGSMGRVKAPKCSSEAIRGQKQGEQA